MRFVLDQDVSADVGIMLRSQRHECWTAHDAGLSEVKDDELTVYASQKRAALLTHDREFSQRRRKRVVGWHVQLRCNEWEAAALLRLHLNFVVDMTQRYDDIFFAMSASGCETSFKWESD
jgi:predicted nuclease of predicted toxin-antitoxin system